MGDITGDTGEGLDIRKLVSGTDVVGVFTSGTSFDDFTIRYIQKLDYSSGIMPIFIGLAEPGTATSTAGWQIRFNSWSGTPLMMIESLFASGNTNFDKIYDDRVTSPYS